MKLFQDKLNDFGNNLVSSLNTGTHGAASSCTEWQLIEKKLDEQAQLIENFVDMQTAQSRMLGTVIRGSYSIPTLCVIVPQVNKSLWNPRNWNIVTDTYRMFFICSHTLRIVPCGPKGKGYNFSVAKDWVKRAAPVLKVGLILLKLGLQASTGIPLPIPGLEDILNVDNSISLLETSLKAIDDIGSDSGTSALTVDQHLHSLTRDDAQIRSAYEAIKSLLTDPTKGLDKQLRHLNMIQRTCEETGVTAWIKNDPAVIMSFDDNRGYRTNPHLE
jgi:hypothetical protein